MPPMFFGNYLKVDLSNGTTEELSLDDSIYKDKIGGASLIASLVDDLNGDCIALGSGPLTGTPCPSGAAAIACIKENNGKMRFSPILLNGGLELRLSGFDFILIQGVSKEPVYLWLRDSAADLIPCQNMFEEDTWRTCSMIRDDQSDSRIQILSCSEGDCASLNFTSGWDGIGLGSLMRRSKLKAIAFRGMADIELNDPDGFMRTSSEMMKKAASSMKGEIGISSLIDVPADKLGTLKRNRSCFSCPFPCLSYVDSGDPAYPQYLLMDQRSVSDALNKGQTGDALFKELSSIHRKGICSSKSVNVFDTMTDGIAEASSIAAAYVLGLCPRYVGLFNPDLDQYCKLLSIGLGEDVQKERLMKTADAIMRA